MANNTVIPTPLPEIKNKNAMGRISTKLHTKNRDFRFAALSIFNRLP